MSDEHLPGALAPTRDAALSRPDFPLARVARRLGLDPAHAEVTLRDDDAARAAIARSVQEFLAADDDRRAGRSPATALALDPDFPTGVGMALVGAAVLWEARDLVPKVALRVAKDHHEDGADELAASYLALVQESVDPGERRDDDALAWAAQSLLVAVLQRRGEPAQAEALARDLAAHAIPIDLWRDADPTLPDDSMAWHGGAFVGGMPPRRDERRLSYEDVHDYMNTLLADMRRDQDAEEDGR
ncbi:hypothetical protein [Brachybacterium saurashtrense]|uniref:Uncharacterized protein n=1 Tax=Brachybacterium saurashtrense TaxID=556288 RepID=A0A345YL43_9MICO|nr:hypothetical protein [Brachybacterium saurashtrense]AXK44645.1 hypothetical protein DWV08_02730 [Brachybacterium saurashtrense]RRR23257.1 hypothetical protein DXU92_07860 [Brachybacterium saurashtrense]